MSTHTLHVFLAGPGLIGKELLRQIADAKVRNYNVVVNGLANSKGFVVSADGLDAAVLAASGADVIAAKGTKGSPVDFVAAAAALKLSHSYFVDTTASDAVSPAYGAALKANLHVVTANKKVTSDGIEYCNEVKALGSVLNGPRFRYEANVGAGLPIIRPLQEFLLTGDKVLTIEAILSGTLSFLFNTFNKDTKFSDVVAEAKALGYTEPDPRDDLSGSDVARKIVILTREAGYPVELKDVEIEGFLPASCVDAPTVDGFFEAMRKDLDADIEARRAAAEARGGVLRYLATLDATVSPPTMKLALKEVPATHAAASVSGSDGIVVIRTTRYDANPCVIKGPGAGAAVCYFF